MQATTKTVVRTWYGLRLTVSMYGTFWASIGPLPPHPQLVNMILRIGLREEDSVHLQILHEIGHLQSLPAVMVLVGLSYLLSLPLLPAVAGLFLVWEILSESYVILKEGENYFRIYRSRRSV